MVKCFTNNPTPLYINKSVVKKLAMGILISNNSILFTTNPFFLPSKVMPSFKLWKSLIIGVILLVMGAVSVSGATIYSNQTGNWSSTSTWRGSKVPTSSDDVVIYSDDNITVDNTSAVCNSLQIGGVSGTYSNTGILTFSSSGNSKLTVTAGVNVGGYGNTNRKGTITFASGSTLQSASVVIGGTGTTPASGTITMTAGGTLITGSLRSSTNNDVFTEGTGTVQLNATNTLASTDTGAEFVTFHNLVISSGITTLARATTISGNLTVNSGATLATDIYQITGNASGTLTLAAGTTLTLGRSITPYNLSDFPTNFVAANVILDPTSTVVFQSPAYQTIPGFTYGNLTISSVSNTNKIAGGNITINGNLTINANTTFQLANNLAVMSIAKQLINNGVLEFDLWSGQTVTVSNNLSGTGTLDMRNGPQILNLNGQNNNIGTLTTDGNNSIVNYGYTGAGSQQVFASPNYRNLTLSGGSAKALQGATTVNNLLTMTSGILTTSSTNSLTIANTATTAITGGSTTSFVNGPVVWSLPSGLGSGSTYNFPIGNGTTYLPFSLVNPTTSGSATAQVQAIVGTSGSTSNVDGTLISKSNTEYWNLVTSANFTNSSVTITRPSAITPSDAIGASTALAGTYTALGGTAGTNTVSNSNTIGSNRYFVFAQAQQTISTGTITGSPFCAGSVVSVPFTVSGTFTSGNIFTVQLSNASGSFASPVIIGTLTSTVAGTISSTIPANTITGSGYRIRVVSSNPAKTGSINGSDLSISASPSTPTTTGANLCIGTSSPVTLSASGAAAGEKYKWYDSLSGGTLLKTSNDNTDNIYTTPNLSTTTNYWVSILNAGGCESSRAQVTATYPGVSTDDQTAAGTDTWIGHVYEGTNQGVAYNGSFANYFGHYTEPTETFDQSFGGDNTCFNITSNSINQSIFTATFSVRYRMNSTKKGLYTVNVGSDDGGRLTIDGNLIYNDWSDHGVNDHTNVLMNLTGSSALVYDFYENGGGNRVYFKSLTQILANNLTSNTTQSVFVGNTGAAISGDVYGTLPGGITTSGTGYQWTYSTTLGGARTSITGATGATYSPITTTAPFNVPGTYYLFRNAVLSSSNNVSPNPYVATDESNAAILTTILMPVITTSQATLNGFSYPVGLGPSTQLKSFTVSGANLTGNITVLPTDSFEISLNSGVSFDPQTLITLSVSNGTVAPSTIYVRMKAGLALNNIAVSNIKCITDNGVTKTVGCSGTVTAAPVVNVTPATLTGFTYMYTNGPSTQNLFAVSGTNLSGNVIVTPPADFEISTVSNSAFQSTPITITASGTLSSTTIYVRMKTGVGVGTITENVVVSSLNTTTANVSCTGTVTPAPTILNSISTLSTFIYTGSGPSGEQSFTIVGTNLSDNIIVTPPANYEISKTSGGTFQSTAITLTQLSGILNAPIFVRLKSGLPVHDYNLESILLTSTGATTKSVSCSGSVVSSSTPTILVSKSSITGFGYKASDGGPSSDQMFTVSGSSLVSNISVAPPSNYYEISLTSGSSYQTTPITLTLTSTRVNPTIIYVHLKKDLAAGDYTGTLTASVGALKKDVSLVGKVFASPMITIGGGGFYCLGSSINLTSTGADIQNRYWQGPNNFYSILQNPPLTTNATVGLTGTYTVTGNVTVGGNLITNGDFESGNISFGSNYGYVAPTSAALQPEGKYTIVANPYSVHSSFTTNGDHTSGSGMQMVINGSPTAGEVVWSQSVPVIAGASYQFTYWLQSVTSTNPSQLQLYVNGISAGPVNTANLTIPLWTQFLYNANAGPNTILNLELINQNTVQDGNDFALDDIVFQQILSATASTDITVAASVPVGVTVSASANPVIQGVTVTYTATPANGGATPVYAWYVNNVLVPGITGATYSYVPSNNDKISCVLTSSISCVTNNPASSNTVTMTVNIGTNYWIGTTSTDWGTPSNWTGVKVPLAGDNVVYATATNNSGKPAVRDLYVDGDRTIGSLINATNKRLVIPANKSLTVNNTITTNGSDSLIYIVSSSTFANGSLIFHNAPDAPVHATVEMYSKAFYDEAGPTNQKYHWQYFGIPVSQVTASPTFDNSYIRRWEESGDAITNHWISLSNGSVLSPFTGYEITQKAATTIVFQGPLVNSDFDSGQLSVTPTALFPGQHVYANPYAAAIDIRQLTFGLQTEATVYLYNTGTFDQWTQSSGANAPGTGAGQYVAVPKNTAGSSNLPRQIPSMQALLVKAMSNSSDATFGITYNTVVMNNTDPQRSPGINYQPGTDQVSTMIDVKGTNYSDRMWLFTQQGCTQNFDNGWDGVKMPGIALTPQIFAVGNDGNYQVNAVDDINNTLLGFQAGQDVEYTMTFTHQNLTGKYEAVFLVDLVENKAVDITESGSTYSFVAESTPTSVNRFKIATRNIEKDAPDKNTQLKIFSSGNTVFVQNLGSLNGEMNIYDMMGRYIRRANFGPYGVTAIQAGSIPGAYVVNAATTGERVSKRIILGK